MSDSLDQVSIVLVEPAVPGNIGSVARVMRNTGMSRLVPRPPRPLAHPRMRCGWPTARRTSWTRPVSWRTWRRRSPTARSSSGPRTAWAGSGSWTMTTAHPWPRPRPRPRRAGASPSSSAARRTASRGRNCCAASASSASPRRSPTPPSTCPTPCSWWPTSCSAASGIRRGGPPPRRWPRPPRSTGSWSTCWRRCSPSGSGPGTRDPSNFERVLRRFLGRAPLERRDTAVLHRLAGQVGKFARRLRQGRDEPSG